MIASHNMVSISHSSYHGWDCSKDSLSMEQQQQQQQEEEEEEEENQARRLE